MLLLLYQSMGYNWAIMLVFLAIVIILAFVALVLVIAARPPRGSYTEEELKRRSSRSEGARLELRRHQAEADIHAIIQAKRTLLVALILIVAVVAFGWFLGIMTALVAVLLSPAVARTRSARRAGAALYRRVEPRLFQLIDRFPAVFRFLHEQPGHDGLEVGSREELIELLERSGGALSEQERTLVRGALTFGAKTVESVMTPRSVIDFIQKKEFLGPLVLSELHELGHSRLPVVDGDLDHVVGIVYLRDLLSLDVKRSVTAEKAMDHKVYYIRADDTLEHALASFLKVRHHLFIVINEQRETVGLLSLEDTIEQLIGRRIVDEDDVYSDLRDEARREARKTNQAPDHVDL